MAAHLVTQATGQQSQWVIKHLLEAGVPVHALVRDVEKVPNSLKHPHITLFEGESQNVEDVQKAAQGCESAFLNTVPFPGLELKQARSVVEACERAGVKTIVAATAFLANRKDLWDSEGIKALAPVHGYYASKFELEDIVRNGKVEAFTILRPSVIHHDFLTPGLSMNFPRLSTEGEIDDLLTEGARIPYTDSYDVGRYAAAAMQDPSKYGGEEIDLAYEVLDFDQVGETLARVSGRDVRVVKRTPEEVEKLGINVFGQYFQLFANIIDLSWAQEAATQVQKRFGLSFTSLEASMQRDKERLLQSLPGASST